MSHNYEIRLIVKASALWLVCLKPTMAGKLYQQAKHALGGAAPMLGDLSEFGSELFLPLSFEDNPADDSNALHDYALGEDGRNRWKPHQHTTVSARILASASATHEMQGHAHGKGVEYRVKVPGKLQAQCLGIFGNDKEQEVMDIIVNQGNRANHILFQSWDGRTWSRSKSMSVEAALNLSICSGSTGVNMSTSTSVGPGSVKVKVVMRSLFAKLELDAAVAKDASTKCFNGSSWDGFTRGLHLGTELEAELEGSGSFERTVGVNASVNGNILTQSGGGQMGASTTEAMSAQTFNVCLKQVGGTHVEASALSGRSLQEILAALEDAMQDNATKPDLWRVLSVDVQHHPNFEYEPAAAATVTTNSDVVLDSAAGPTLTQDNLRHHSNLSQDHISGTDVPHSRGVLSANSVASDPSDLEAAFGDQSRPAPAILGREDIGYKWDPDPCQVMQGVRPAPLPDTTATASLIDMAKNTERQLETLKIETQSKMHAHTKALEESWKLEMKHAASARESLEKKLTQANEVADSLHVGKGAVKKMDAAERWENMSRIVFFLALLSAEMAIMSYVLNFLPLWHKAAGELKPIAHALIVISPVAYAGAVASFFWFDGKVPNVANRLGQYLKFSRPELLIEHWMVGCRMFLAIKSISEDDVAAFFLVHRLTAVVFSLFQALLLTILHFQEVDPVTWRDWNLEWLVVGSAAFNFLIEAAAMSGLANGLKRSIKMEALVYNNKKIAMFDRVTWMVTCNTSAKTAAPRWCSCAPGLARGNSSVSSLTRRINVTPDKAVLAFRESIETEIHLWAALTPELRTLDMEMLADLQVLMQRRHIHGGK